MRIIVNHLTRMQPGYMCLAGINATTGRHVRPVIYGRLPITNLRRYGGPFDVACLVDLGPTECCGHVPEVEDHRFDPARAALVRVLDPQIFWKILLTAARRDLAAIFGPDLTPRGAGACAVGVGKGIASLGCLITDSRPTLYVHARKDRPSQVRIGFEISNMELDLGVTDIRLYGSDHVTPEAALVAAIARKLKQTSEVVLSIGLTRPYSADDEHPAVHWLQVNNIHLPDRPVWQLG